MTDLLDFFYVDNVDKVKAEHINNLLAATLRAEYRNEETLSADRALLDADTPIQVLTPDAADRDVNLPSVATTNHPFFIENPSATSHKLLIKSGATTLVTLARGQSALVASSGGAWYAVGNHLPSNMISGLKLTWVSATALTVETGFAFLPDGTRVTVSANIAKSSLTLNASTFHHVYLYLNAGVPDIEIVTTAPAAPYFGTARAKTGDTSRRYLGSILTNASGHIRDFSHNPTTDEIRYINTNFDVSPFRALSVGVATTATPVDLSATIPVTALSVYSRNINTANTGMFMGSPALMLTAYNLAVSPGADVVAFQPIYSQAIYYMFSSAPASGAGYLDVYGYIFRR